MRLTDVLHDANIIVRLEANSIREAMEALAERLVTAGAIPSMDVIDTIWRDQHPRDLLWVGGSAAIAHRRAGRARELAVALGVLDPPLENDRAGTDRVRVVALVLSPPGKLDRYLQVVGALTRVLRDEAVISDLEGAESPQDVLAIRAFAELTLPEQLTVRDVMTQRVYRVFADSPLQELLSLMARHRLRAVPVVGDGREVVGIVSDRDVLGYLMPRVLRVSAGDDREGSGHRVPIASSEVRDVMSRSVMCVSEDQSIADVASLMVNKDVERFPVVREGRLTGFLTRGDIIRKMFG